jgi:hypothetical protein
MAVVAALLELNIKEMHDDISGKNRPFIDRNGRLYVPRPSEQIWADVERKTKAALAALPPPPTASPSSGDGSAISPSKIQKRPVQIRRKRGDNILLKIPGTGTGTSTVITSTTKTDTDTNTKTNTRNMANAEPDFPLEKVKTPDPDTDVLTLLERHNKTMAEILTRFRNMIMAATEPVATSSSIPQASLNVMTMNNEAAALVCSSRHTYPHSLHLLLWIFHK